MKQFLVLGLVALALLGAAAVAWCEGGAAAAPGLAPQAGGGLQPVITTSELAVGQNRLAFGLLKEHKLFDAADVMVRVYELYGQPGQLKAQTRAPYARLEIVEQGQRVHLHPDGTRHVHNEATDVHGIYVTHINFERPGIWGLEILARQGDGPVEVSRFTVRLLLDSRVVDVPLSSNPMVVTLSSLKPFFFNGLKSGGALLGPWWSIRPQNPIRAYRQCPRDPSHPNARHPSAAQP